MEVATMTQSADDELAQLRAQRMAQIQSQLEEQAAAQADAQIQEESQQAAMAQLDAAMKAIVDNGWGCLLYLRQEGRGIGLHAKIQAYHLQDQGADTLDANLILGHPADGRNYQIAATMLNDLGISNVALLTNNPDKVKQLEDHGIVVAKTVPLVAGIGEDNLLYLQTKVQRMGHTIDSDELE